MPALHRDRDTSDYRDQKDDDREISLGTGTILAIFFALALICAAFFGFGYSMGRKSVQAPANAAVSAEAVVPASTFSSFKPPAGSPASQPSVTATKEPEVSAAAPADSDNEIVTTPVSSTGDASGAARSTPAARKEVTPEATAAPIVREAPRTGQPTSQGQAQPSAMPAVNPNGTAIVQVAAVSHQEDADTLIAALKKRGYTVFIRQEPQDKLLHVQLGPFATKKDAEAMRQRLLADGYNAIVK